MDYNDIVISSSNFRIKTKTISDIARNDYIKKNTRLDFQINDIILPRKKAFKNRTDYTSGYSSNQNQSDRHLNYSRINNLDYSRIIDITLPRSINAVNREISSADQFKPIALINDPDKISKFKALKNYFRNRLVTSVFIVFAVILIAVGAYLSFLGWKENNIAIKQAKLLTNQANISFIKSPQTTSTVKPIEAPKVISTVKPTTYSLSSYVVGPNMPRYIIIPKYNIDTVILNVGILSNGALGTPDNVFDTAWYNQSSLPGQPGAMLVDGHVSSWTSPGVFYNLHNMAAGDIIKIVTGNNTTYTYQVISKTIYSANSVDMTAALTPVDSGVPGLNLITCTGHVIPGTSSFNERVIVFSKLIS